MIKKYLIVGLYLINVVLYSQTDFSNTWEDFFSYNNVKDFIKVENKIYAVVDNAVFIYDITTKQTEKLSSVNGLSGEISTSIHYSLEFKKLVIGYANGLLEIVDDNGEITIAPDLSNFTLFTERKINNITEYNGKLYLSTPFAIVVYDIEHLIFGDTYFIGDNSSEVWVNEIEIFENTIFAATENGFYTANINQPNLIDFNNWTKFSSGNFSSIEMFNNQVVTSRGRGLFSIINQSSLQLLHSLPSTILKIKASVTNLAASMSRQAIIYDANITQIESVISDSNSDYYFQLNSSLSVDNKIYLGTREFGILETSMPHTSNFTEIHPDGPNSNTLFSITAGIDQLWVVYGGYNSAYNVLGKKLGFSHFTNNKWINTPYNINFPARDLVNITIDPNHDNRAYISSWFNGVLEIENENATTLFDESNSGLEQVFGAFVVVDGTSFDSQGNFWTTNGFVDNLLKKRTTSGTWSSYDLSSILTNTARGLNELVIDKTGSIWIGTRRNGALVYNENGDRKKALIAEPTKGSLPDPNVRTVAVDNSNRIWIGTKKGMVVFYNASGLFDADIYDAEPIIILDEGIPKKLLGDLPVNSIAVDGADNKWFGTDGGGALQSNPNGQKTLNIFNKSNSPLPSNTILKITIDNSNGKVYFGTDKGIVAYNSDVAPFGDELGEVYAFPNPVKKQHEFVTIDGRNGTHLPQGTNVKILDSAGYLVYETNVVEGQELQGGKVIWDKKNLAGRKVASGVYIVLLTNKDATETSSTKIAIIN